MPRTLFVLTLLLFSRISASAQAVATAASIQSGLDATVSINMKGVSIREALSEIGRQARLDMSFGKGMFAVRNVTVQVSNVSAREAIRRVIVGTDIGYTVAGTGQLLFAQGQGVKVAHGVITGRVTDGKSGKGVAGANVSFDINGLSGRTGEDGSYRIAGVNAGNHTVVVRLVGYAKQSKSVTVGDGATVNVDFKLEPSTNVLDQVVVTGTIIASELRSVPNAITVITAKDIEQRGITRIDQLFRGEVPGFFVPNDGSVNTLDQVTIFSRGATSLDDNSQTGIRNRTNPIKTYLDGIELNDPSYLSQIDPRSIERIEILSGPQSSTIYGSNAINGVMQIFTKRGISHRPQATVNLLTGFVQNNFNSALTPQHDYSGSLNGTEGALSYNFGGSWTYIGAWTPGRKTGRTNMFGGSHMTIGNLTSDVSMRRSFTRNVQKGSLSQGTVGLEELGLYNSALTSAGRSTPAFAGLSSRTLGLEFGYAPNVWWSHRFVIGDDVSELNNITTEPRYNSPLSSSDTLLFLNQNSRGRKSLQYNTTMEVPVMSTSKIILTMGADNSKDFSTTITVSPVTLAGFLTGSPTIERLTTHNTGGFVQTQFSIMNALFLTYGLRAEWNPSYGDDIQPNLAPRYGVAYTRDIGFFSAKVRGSYGRSTRPPSREQKRSVASTNATNIGIFGPWNITIANPDLGPESQQGGEGGLELYIGNHGSLIITRYNQTVDNLIAAISPADSIRSLFPNPPSSCSSTYRDANGYCYRYQSQFLNVGSIRNQGWELQSTINAGPFSTKGTYSWTKSRVLGITPKYRGILTGSRYYIAGASFDYLSEHTWAVNVTYARGTNLVALSVNGTGFLYPNTDELALSVSSSVRLDMNRPRMGTPSGYRSISPGYSTSDINVMHRFSSYAEAVVQIQNLLNFYRNDNQASFATIGRQTRLGLRYRFN